MADKSVYGRLKRLFSNNVIVRRVGKDQIKIVDNDALQSSGNLNVSRYIDRFTRLHGVKSQLSTFNNNYNYNCKNNNNNNKQPFMFEFSVLLRTLNIKHNTQQQCNY